MIKDKCKLVRALFDCVHEVLKDCVNSSYSWTDKINLIGLIELHVKFINHFLEVLKNEKNESKSEKK